MYKKMGNIVGNWPRKENTEIRDLSKEGEIFKMCVLTCQPGASHLEFYIASI